MEHYRSQRYAHERTHQVRISDTAEFFHHGVTQPDVTPADRLHHGIHALTEALKKSPVPIADLQLDAI